MGCTADQIPRKLADGIDHAVKCPRCDHGFKAEQSWPVILFFLKVIRKHTKDHPVKNRSSKRPGSDHCHAQVGIPCLFNCLILKCAFTYSRKHILQLFLINGLHQPCCFIRIAGKGCERSPIAVYKACKYIY